MQAATREASIRAAPAVPSGSAARRGKVATSRAAPSPDKDGVPISARAQPCAIGYFAKISSTGLNTRRSASSFEAVVVAPAIVGGARFEREWMVLYSLVLSR